MGPPSTRRGEKKERKGKKYFFPPNHRWLSGKRKEGISRLEKGRLVLHPGGSSG